ncbi:hypothetical protein ACFFQF_14160 [Haladaptatus pallidirubidus]|uniref:DUF7504 family protein n=1 Tax=Haladaptatus pallidirubidus TaxID=1008152 RepID=UPI0035E87647
MTEPTSDFGLNRRILVSVPTLQADTCEDRLQLLDDETESVVAVMYDRSADEFLQSWRNQIGTVPNDAQIVDIEQPIRSMATESTNETSGNGDTVVQTVQRPDDLREIETAIKAALESATGKTTLVFDSLTSLQSTSRSSISFRFFATSPTTSPIVTRPAISISNVVPTTTRRLRHSTQ